MNENTSFRCTYCRREDGARALAHANYTLPVPWRFMWTFYYPGVKLGAGQYYVRTWINPWEAFPKCPEDATRSRNYDFQTRRQVEWPLSEDYINLYCDVGEYSETKAPKSVQE